MTNFLSLPAWNSSGQLHVVVESPRGSALKLKYDADLGAFTVSRPLLNGLAYPYDWGFVPGTRAADGDPLDAMVLAPFAGVPGMIWACQPIGLVVVTQPSKERNERVHNDRVLAVPVKAPRADALRDVSQLATREREELKQFFLASVVLDKSGVEIVGFQGADAARTAIRAAQT